MLRITRGHHVLRIEHLESEFGDGDRAVLLRSTRGEGSESGHEEVQPREGDHVDRQFPQVRVQLPGETEARGDARHGGGDEVVQVPVGRSRQLQRAEADVVERLVVDAEGLVRVLDELVDREHAVVRLHHRVRHLHS